MGQAKLRGATPEARRAETERRRKAAFREREEAKKMLYDRVLAFELLRVRKPT
jgi:hypothetical protein